MSRRDQDPPETVHELLLEHPADQPALRSTDGLRLTYGQLREQVDSTRTALGTWGVGRGDAVALVLQNGPHMAAAFAGVASAATTAPLHPGLREHEFRGSLDSLRAKALIVDSGEESAATAAATGLGIPILQLERTTAAGRLPTPAGERTQAGPGWPCFE